MTVWHWLVYQGQLYHAIINWAVGFVMGGLAARLGVSRLTAAWHEHLGLQRRQVELLDDQTPGGLGTIRELLEKSNKEEQQ